MTIDELIIELKEAKEFLGDGGLEVFSDDKDIIGLEVTKDNDGGWSGIDLQVNER